MLAPQHHSAATGMHLLLEGSTWAGPLRQAQHAAAGQGNGKTARLIPGHPSKCPLCVLGSIPCSALTAQKGEVRCIASSKAWEAGEYLMHFVLQACIPLSQHALVLLGCLYHFLQLLGVCLFLPFSLLGHCSQVQHICLRCLHTNNKNNSNSNNNNKNNSNSITLASGACAPVIMTLLTLTLPQEPAHQ